MKTKITSSPLGNWLPMIADSFSLPIPWFAMTLPSEVLLNVPKHGLLRPTPSLLDPTWDGSDINLEAACQGNGKVILKIRNRGKGNMADSSTFRILLDAQTAYIGRFRLSISDSLILNIPASGATVRLEADQRPGHPIKKQSNISVEACGAGVDGQVSIGYVSQFPQDDVEPEVAVECLSITDSYDPNDKNVSPLGVTSQKYTPSGHVLDYVIRFQNTGTDVAYKVVVVDTLSDQLDISTLQVGAASHPYKMQVSGQGNPVLAFIFDNINLPDSTSDKTASNGFIQFSIKPKVGLPVKARIENYADIFFDYNEPIRTNTTINTIYDMPLVIVDAVRLNESIICNANVSVQAGDNQILCWQLTETNLQALSPGMEKAVGKGSADGVIFMTGRILPPGYRTWLRRECF